MGIVETARDCKEIMAGPPVTCGDCKECLFSLFDKLYISAWGQCATCTPDNDLDHQSSAIFAIIKGV
jgi:hypothetical protein